jgi:hypothetical protein
MECACYSFLSLDQHLHVSMTLFLGHVFLPAMPLDNHEMVVHEEHEDYLFLV